MSGYMYIPIFLFNSSQSFIKLKQEYIHTINSSETDHPISSRP
ncbi:hypothetical protein C8P67_11922 [Flavobacterium aquicola]|uniref:Uncharacterized protein n=1 Tax=Flavobacterium aquicola TaxID=1682742 RepID=A0A3E0DZG6_9FLAO|nr:hypothetical protein C8P67_11922 [Flavobacterium aquicola]